MQDSAVKKSYEIVLNDSKFVKLTIFSLLPYSLLFVGYLFYQTYFFITSIQHGIHWQELKLYVENIFHFGENYFWILAFIFLFIVLAYFFIPPIAEASLIYYLNGENKSIGKAFGKGLLKFFPMFELHGFLSLFSFLFFFIVISRLYIVGMLDTTFILPLIIVWGIFCFFFNFSAIYAKYLIVLENLSPFEAIKKSILLTFVNFSSTLKYFGIYLILYVRFIMNILVLVGLPILVLYLFLKTDVSNDLIVKSTIYLIMFVLFILTAYVNGIVEAFFISMWNEVFRKIEKI